MKGSWHDRKLKVGIPALSLYGLEKEQDIQVGNVVKILDVLKMKLNFSYELIPFAVYNLGNDSRKFIFDHLQRQKVDMVASRIPYLRSERTVSYALGQEEWFVLQRKHAVSNSLLALLSPFELKVWILVALSVVIVAPAMYGFYRCYMRVCHCGIKKVAPLKLRDYFFFVVVSLLRQDHKLHLAIHSQRLMMAIWWISGLLLVTFYTANLAASLAKPVRERLIESPNDLMRPEFRHLKWITLEQHFIQNENLFELHENLKSDLKSGKGRLIRPIESAVDLIKEGQGYVWFGPYGTLVEVLLAQYRGCRSKLSFEVYPFSLSESKFMTVKYGLTFLQKSALSDTLTELLTILDQTGIVKSVTQSNFSGMNPFSREGERTARSMRMDDLFGLFAVCLSFYGVSLIAFLSEQVVYFLNKRRKAEETSLVQLDLYVENNFSVQRRIGDKFIPAALRVIPSFYLEDCSDEPSVARRLAIDYILQESLKYDVASVSNLLYVKN